MKSDTGFPRCSYASEGDLRATPVIVHMVVAWCPWAVEIISYRGYKEVLFGRHQYRVEFVEEEKPTYRGTAVVSMSDY